MAEGTISMGHAKAILSLDTAAKQMLLRREILSRGLSVREAEGLAGKMKAPGRMKTKRTKPPSAQYAMLEDELKAALGTRVRIRPKGKGGRIEIEYFSGEEFERLLDVLRD